MNLVPEDYQLEADVMILNKDIGFVRPEQDVEIKTGKRRVIEYLISPVMKYLNESMRER